MAKNLLNNKTIKADIVIVGGGLAGTAAAICIAQLGINTIHLAPTAVKDRRTSALMGPSIDILTSSGLVPDPDKIGVKMNKIRIIDATNRLIRSPEALFDSREAGLNSFGYNFANEKLLKAFDEKAQNIDSYQRIVASFEKIDSSDNGITIKTDDGKTINCQMLVGADGKKSSVRSNAGIGIKEKKHKQSALVCNLELERELDGASVEYHYKNGPFTLVPAGGKKANLVWMDKHEVLQRAKNADEEDFIGQLEKLSMDLFGNIKLTSGVFIFPLTNLMANSVGKNGIVLAGEAAHAFPPVGAQGLNLSLRDIVDLVDVLKTTDKSQINWGKVASETYNKKRMGDLKGTLAMVETLFKSLLADFIPVQAMRAGGVWALKSLPFLRKKAFHIGMGER